MKHEIEDILKSKKGVNHKLNAILSALTLANLAFGLLIKPNELLVHPHNRGGSMVNAYNCHTKGQAILEAGLKPDLLAPNSICIEMSKDPQKRKAQLEANETMCANSDGLLGDVSGTERFLTLGNSHWVMFCKAMQQQAKSPDGQTLHTPPELEALVEHGWNWTVVSSVVEEQFPSLPSFCQSALNSVNSNTTVTSELEAMLQMAQYMKEGQSLQNAIASVEAAQPACSKYLQDVASFVRQFSGGDGFPLLNQLKDFCSLVGTSFGHCLSQVRTFMPKVIHHLFVSFCFPKCIPMFLSSCWKNLT